MASPRKPMSGPRPFPLLRLDLELDDVTARMVGEAELAVRSFERTFDDPVRAQAFADACLHIESLASVKMNGRQTSARRTLREAIVQPRRIDSRGLETKQEALRSDDALLTACDLGVASVTAHTFCEINRQLLTGTTRESYRGLLRVDEHLVGGGRYRAFGEPCSITDPANIARALHDLAAYCDRTTPPSIVQAALAHAQLLAIHPFVRANGKTARAVIQLVFRHRGLVSVVVVPLSLAMATSTHDYQRGVAAARENLLSEKPRVEYLNAWLRYFCVCCTQAAEEVDAFEARAGALQNAWLAQLATRSDSAATLLVHALPGIPVFTVASAAAYLDRSFKRAASAVDELTAAGIVSQITEGKRNRVFECPDIVDAYAGIRGFQ